MVWKTRGGKDGRGREIGDGTLYGPLAWGRGRTARRRQRADTLSLTQPPAKIADGNSLSRHGHTHHSTPATPSALAQINICPSFSPYRELHTDEHGVRPPLPIFSIRPSPRKCPQTISQEFYDAVRGPARTVQG